VTAPTLSVATTALALVGVDPLAVLEAVRTLLAHVGGLSRAAANAAVPSWLTVVTGGALVGGSFLFNSLLTDHEAIRAVNGWRARLPTTATVRRVVIGVLRIAGVAVLGLVLVTSVVGPRDPSSNFAILVVWAGWWAGYAMSTYLVGNTWPAVNPWRTLARWLPTGESRSFPERLGAWPSVVGLLGLVWVEVVSPLAAEPTALGALVLGYTLLTLAGASRYGTETWFETVDPVSQVFRLYGRVAPLQFRDGGVEVRLPGTALTEGEAPRESGSTAFVVALLWVTTFDGLVATPIWSDVAHATIGAVELTGLAQTALVLGFYLLALLAGFAVFLGGYRLAAARARQSAGSYLAPDTIERWLVPSLLPIAAGYHLAHFLGYFLSLSPALGAVLAHPLGGVGVARVAVLPAWFGTLQLTFVVLGHLLAVWIAHALAMDLFPGVLRPIRSQYPFVVVMMVYTMTSAVVIGQPFTEPAFL
jgi:hypothetical protein